MKWWPGCRPPITATVGIPRTISASTSRPPRSAARPARPPRSAGAETWRPASFAANCASCPLASACTTSKAGRTISIHPHEQTLQNHKVDQQTSQWQDAYTPDAAHRRTENQSLRVPVVGRPQGPHPRHTAGLHRRRHPGGGAQLGPPGRPRCALERRGLGRGGTMTRGAGSLSARCLPSAWYSRSPQNPENEGEWAREIRKGNSGKSKNRATTPFTTAT